MRSGYAWATGGLVVAALVVSFVLSRDPAPAAPVPVRLGGEVTATLPPGNELVVVPPPTYWLGDGTPTTSIPDAPVSTDTAGDSPDDAATGGATDSVPPADDSLDSPDDDD